MLEMLELWDISQGKLLTGKVANQPKREKYITVSRAENSYRCGEHFVISKGDTEFGVYSAGFQRVYEHNKLY